MNAEINVEIAAEYSHPDAFQPYSALYHLLRAATPKNEGYNQHIGKRIYAASQTELNALGGHAGCASTTFVGATRAIGMLMLYCDKAEITNDVWGDVGDLLIMLGEGQMALRDLQNVAECGTPADPQNSKPTKGARS